MGRGREETLVRDFNSVARENDELKAITQQMQMALSQAHAENGQLKNAYGVMSRLFAAAIKLGEGQKLKAKHRDLAGLPPTCQIFKRELDDVWMEFEVIETQEQMDAIRRELGIAADNDDDAAESSGDGDEVVRQEEDGDEVGDGGRLVNEFGSPLSTD